MMFGLKIKVTNCEEQTKRHIIKESFVLQRPIEAQLFQTENSIFLSTTMLRLIHNNTMTA